jgi:hypothetical protein
MSHAYGMNEYVMSKDMLPSRCEGMTAYRGVLILWDEDYDTRVVDLLDGMTDAERRELVAVHENEGCVFLCWRAMVPERFRAGMVGVANDHWTAYHQVGDGDELTFDGHVDISKPAPIKEDRPSVALMFVVAA